MNVNLLIDAIVRQTTVLIAQLATSAGARAPLAHVANQVFLDLTSELRQQGLGQKVIADMFGMALRTYHARIQRLNESATDRGTSLWEAVLDHLRASGDCTRAELLLRFRADDDATIRGVLHDLTESGLVVRTGRGDRTSYRAADEKEIRSLGSLDRDAATQAMVWVAVHRNGPVSGAWIAEWMRADVDEVLDALEALSGQGRVRATGPAKDPLWTAQDCIIQYEDPVGWEAAVLDHYQAMVVALCTKLTAGERTARHNDAVGGSTFVFDLCHGHPMEDEVKSFLSQVRAQASALRQRVDAASAALPEDGQRGTLRVIFYAGQTVQTDETDEDPSA